MSQLALFRPDPEVDLVYLDPPWREDDGGGRRGAQEHYQTHAKERILEIVVGARWPDGSRVYAPAADSHMRLWCTTLSLPSALWLMGQLGFKYSTCDVWVKHGSWSAVADRVVGALRRCADATARLTDLVGGVHDDLAVVANGLAEALELLGEPADARDAGQLACGQYRRSAHELLLYGTRGRFARGPLATTTSSVVGGRVIPVPRARGAEGHRVHSRKPEEAWAHVEATSPYERRVALFERGTARPGWRFWGDEVGMFASAGE